MPTRCCMPPDSCFGKLSERAESPMRASSVRPMRSASAAPRPASSGPRLTFSITVFQGNSVGSWNTTPRSAPGSVTRSPSTVARPLSAATKPASTLSKVDLPQPEGPSTQTNWPLGISSEMRSRISLRWAVVPRCTITSSNATLPARVAAAMTGARPAPPDGTENGLAGIIAASPIVPLLALHRFEVLRHDERLIGRARFDFRQALLVGEEGRGRDQRVDELALGLVRIGRSIVEDVMDGHRATAPVTGRTHPFRIGSMVGDQLCTQHFGGE